MASILVSCLQTKSGLWTTRVFCRLKRPPVTRRLWRRHFERNSFDSLTLMRRLSFALHRCFLKESSFPRPGCDCSFGPEDGAHRLQRQVTCAINLLVRLSLMEESGPAREAVQMHPLVRSLSVASIQEDDRQRIRVSAAERLGVAYRNNQRLYSEYRGRGADQIIEDLTTGVDWSNSSGQTATDLSLLHHLLDRERRTLSPDDGPIGAGDFFQALHFRAASMGAERLSGRFANQLAKESSELSFVARGTTANESLNRLGQGVRGGTPPAFVQWISRRKLRESSVVRTIAPPSCGTLGRDGLSVGSPDIQRWCEPSL